MNQAHTQSYSLTSTPQSMSIFTMSVYPLLQARESALSLPLASRFGSAPCSQARERVNVFRVDSITITCSILFRRTFCSRNSTTAICPCAAAHIRGVKPSSSWRLITVSVQRNTPEIKICWRWQRYKNRVLWVHFFYSSWLLGQNRQSL